MRKATLCLVLAGLMAVSLPLANIAAAASIPAAPESPSFVPVLPRGERLTEHQLGLVRGDGFFLTVLYITGKAILGVAKKALVGAAAGVIGGAVVNWITGDEITDDLHCDAIGGALTASFTNPYLAAGVAGAAVGICML